MNDHAGRESSCGREMGNNEFSWSGLTILHDEYRSVLDCHSLMTCHTHIIT